MKPVGKSNAGLLLHSPKKVFMRRIIWFFLLLSGLILSTENVMATYVYGKVTDQKGEPLSYADVLVKGTKKGTATNTKGFYELDLKSGHHTLIFRYTGYKSAVKQIKAGEKPHELNVSLEKQTYDMEPVTVTDKDPAYRVIRNAIERKSRFRKEVSQYRCKVYTKAKMKADTLSGSSIIDSSALPKGYLYLSESVSRLSYQYPDQFKEKVISSRVSGSSEGISLNFVFNEPIFFYENLINIEDGTKRPIVSPIADNAFFYYDYDWKGTFREHQKRIHRVRVIPKRKTDPVFKGYIHIVDKTWRIQSINLSITESNGLNQFDTLRLKQTYLPIKDSIWRLYNQNFTVNGTVLGLGMTLHSLTHFSKYDINPNLGKAHFGNELIKITEKASKKDASRWEKIRPVKLGPEEVRDFKRKDSLEKIYTSPAYIDSLDSVRNKPTVGGILFSGYNYRKRIKNFRFSLKPIFYSVLQFNTVEGLAPELKMRLQKTYEQKPNLEISPFIRYGFSNHHLNGGLTLDKKRWSLQLGRDVRQFNPDKPISEFWNTVNTVFSGINVMKIYESTHAQIGYNREIGNGWFPSLEVNWAKREPLQNTTQFTFAKEGNRYFSTNTPNHPYFKDLKTFHPHEVFTVKAGLNFKPGLQYMTIKGKKMNLGTPFPTLKLRYKKSIPGVGGSDANFDFASIGLDGEFDFKLVGKMDLRGTGGLFLNKNRIPFMDFQHFTGQELLIHNPNKTRFQLLDYYEASTTKPFVKGHLKHHFNGFLWNKLPWAKRLKWDLVANANILYQQNQKPYWEWGITLSNIFNVLGRDLFKVSYYQSYSGTGYKSRGVRIGWGLDGSRTNF